MPPSFPLDFHLDFLICTKSLGIRLPRTSNTGSDVACSVFLTSLFCSLFPACNVSIMHYCSKQFHSKLPNKQLRSAARKRERRARRGNRVAERWCPPSLTPVSPWDDGSQHRSIPSPTGRDPTRVDYSRSKTMPLGCKGSQVGQEERMGGLLVGRARPYPRGRGGG